MRRSGTRLITPALIAREAFEVAKGRYDTDENPQLTLQRLAMLLGELASSLELSMTGRITPPAEVAPLRQRPPG